MASTTKVPLGASTLNRKWYLDVNTGTYAIPVWTGVFGVEEFKAGLDPTVEDDADFDSGGYKSSTITALGWSLELKLARKVTAADATAYDPGQEALRAAAYQMGTLNKVDVRWYEVTSAGPKTEAYRGYAAVSWVPDGGAMDALDTVSVTLTGMGARTAVTHPDGTPTAIPIVSSVDPATAATAGGTLISVGGSNFTGATVVNMDATAFTEFDVLSDNLIIGVVPAKAGGTYVVKITNPAGSNTTGASVTYS